jgi:type I restriction enzyme S subunit
MNAVADRVSLGGLCELISVQRHPADMPEARYVGLEHVPSGRLRWAVDGKASDMQSQKFAFQRNDVLYGKLRPYLDKAVLADSDGLCTTELLVLRAKPGVSPRFLACVVHAPDFIAHAMAGVTGAHHPRTSWNHISDFDLPKYNPEAQQRIAALLWRIHDLIDACQASTGIAQALRQVSMRELFTRGLRGEAQKDTEIGMLPSTWKVLRLDACAAAISTRMSYSELEAAQPSTATDVVPVLGIKVSDMNRAGSEIDLAQAALTVPLDRTIAQHRCAPPGTIIFPKRGAAIATNKKRFATAWTVFDPNVIGVRAGAAVVPRFLFHWFQNFDLRTITEPGPTPQLNKKNLDPLLLPVPTDMDEQQEIVTILDAIDRKIDLHQRKRAVLEDLFKALLHKLMTGEIAVDDLDLSALDRAAVTAEEATV